jgi:16S rRNA (cytosine967-C5)-methyltransferase
VQRCAGSVHFLAHELMPASRFASRPDIQGLATRRIAAEMIDGVLSRRRPLDEQLEVHQGFKTLSDRDRALTRRLVATVLRRLGTLRALLNRMLERGVPHDSQRTETALLIGAAQILWMDVPDHAAVDLSVRLVQSDRRGAKYAGLVNAVLRRCTREGAPLLAELATQTPDIPPWLMKRWVANYGESVARQIAVALAYEPALDITVKGDATDWAARLHGEVLPTGSVRTMLHGPVALLPGFNEGQWWVQDAAAALPARLFGDVKGKKIVDLCAAPGGKTAQLAFAGAEVTAIDRSPARAARLRDNLARLGLTAEVVVADANGWSDDNNARFDGVLVDAPCTATGTIRRHPDIAWLKSEADVTTLAAAQRKLLRRAVALLKPGGTLLYCSCSLEPEEGEQAIEELLSSERGLRRVPVQTGEVGGLKELISPPGDLRTLPCHLPAADPRLAGLDGFYAARLVKP